MAQDEVFEQVSNSNIANLQYILLISIYFTLIFFYFSIDTLLTYFSYQFEDEESEIPIGGSLTSGRKRLFSKELRCMMYGFGDDQNPYTESVDLLEDLVIEYITEMTHRAMEIGRTGRVQVEDIVFLG